MITKCSKCGAEKPKTDFPTKGRRCNACAAEATRVWYDSQDTESRKRISKQRNAWHQNKLRTDPEYRARHLARRRRRYATTPEVYSVNEAKRAATRRLTPAGRARQLLTGARMRDAACTLELKDILPYVEKGTCPRTGFKFDFVPHETHRRNPFSPSLDRLDASKGYVKGNVQVVCSWYNIAKNEYTDEQMLAFCKAVVDASRKQGV